MQREKRNYTKLQNKETYSSYSVFISILNDGYRTDATTVHFIVVHINIGTFNDRYRLDAILVHYTVLYIGVCNDGYRLVKTVYVKEIVK